MHIKIIYPKNVVDLQREKVVRHICEVVKDKLDLPEYIELEFQFMNLSTYAETILDKKRIVINLNLGLKDIVIPLVHELIHLHQIYKGQLAISKTGCYVWEGVPYDVEPIKMSHIDYNNLPWELDVAKKQKILLEKLLKN